MPNRFKFPPPPPPNPSSLSPPLTTTGGGTRAACAACKHQRKKCTSTCIFAPYFPQALPQKFEFAQKVFGIKNMSKMAEQLTPDRRTAFFDSIVMEARERVLNPVEGCTGQVVKLRRENQELQQEIVILREQLRICENLLRHSNGNGNGFANYNGNSNGNHYSSNNYGCLYGNGFPFNRTGTARVVHNTVQGNGVPAWTDGE